MALNNRVTLKRRYNLIFVITVITLILGCSQTNNSTDSEDITEQDSYISKKSYQQRLTKWFRPYKIDVQQGNILTDEMLGKLKTGISKQQAKQLLGTSVLSESPAKNQWLYVFTDEVNGVTKREQRLVLNFKDDKLVDIKQDTKQDS